MNDRLPPIEDMTPEWRAAWQSGWAAGYRDAMADVSKAAASVPPVKEVLLRCQECGQFMEIGQPALPVESDAYGNRLWIHESCPPEPSAPAPLLAPDAPTPAKASVVYPLRATLDQPDGPGDGMRVLHALRSARGDGSAHYVLTDSPERFQPAEEDVQQHTSTIGPTGSGKTTVESYHLSVEGTELRLTKNEEGDR